MSGCRPTDLDPLYETVDTDALNMLFEPLEDRPCPPDTELYLPQIRGGSPRLESWVTYYLLIGEGGRVLLRAPLTHLVD